MPQIEQLATPGTVVPSGAQIAPAGQVGPPGTVGIDSFTQTTTSFTVPAVGSTAVVTLKNASWAIVGQMLWIDQAGGGVGQPAVMQVTAINGNQITVLNPSVGTGYALASPTGSGLMAQTSGNITDYIGGDNASHSLGLNPYVAPNCGQLSYVSTTTLQFVPYKGDLIKINGVIYHIPSGGIVGLANTNVFVGGVAGQNLVAATLYYVYCFNNAGVLTADFWTAATGPHSPSVAAGNVGVEIRTGDNTRTLIGMVVVGTGAIFYDSAQYRFTRSWFNDPRKRFGFNPGTSATVPSTAAVTVATCTILGWNGESFIANGTGYYSAATVPTSGWNSIAATTAVGGSASMLSSTSLTTVSAASTAYTGVCNVATGDFTADGSINLNFNVSLSSGTNAMTVGYPTLNGILGGND